MSETALVVPGITSPSTLAILARARTYPLYCQSVADTLAGKCPFCELDPKFNVVILYNACWNAWQSRAPEKHTKHHFIIAPKRHVTDTEDLNSTEWHCLAEIMKHLRETHGYTSRGILIRDGDARLSAGTVEHLHVHVMVPDGTGRVESPFYKGAQADFESLTRAIIFEKMRQGTPYEQLTILEQDWVKDRLK